MGKSVKDNLSKFDICNLVVIDNGIYVPEDIESSPDVFSNPLNLLFVGALNYSKGIKNLVESLNQLQTENVNVHLHIMGEWSNKIQKEEILYYIQQNNLTNVISFHGLVTTIEKWKIFKMCLILIHPTYWDGQPLVILEAMGCGLSIISTNVGAIPDTMINGYNGIILPENNSAQLSNAIKNCNNNREWILETSKNNLKTYNERFTIESYILRIANWLEQ